jgi:hypothetical protein
MGDQRHQRKLLLVAAGAIGIVIAADAATGDWLGAWSSLALLAAVLMLAWGVPDRSRVARILFYAAIAVVFVIVTIQLFRD